MSNSFERMKRRSACRVLQHRYSPSFLPPLFVYIWKVMKQMPPSWAGSSTYTSSPCSYFREQTRKQKIEKKSAQNTLCQTNCQKRVTNIRSLKKISNFIGLIRFETYQTRIPQFLHGDRWSLHHGKAWIIQSVRALNETMKRIYALCLNCSSHHGWGLESRYQGRVRLDL